jgi:hypothetical protein
MPADVVAPTPAAAPSFRMSRLLTALPPRESDLRPPLDQGDTGAASVVNVTSGISARPKKVFPF